MIFPIRSKFGSTGIAEAGIGGGGIPRSSESVLLALFGRGLFFVRFRFRKEVTDRDIFAR